MQIIGVLLTLAALNLGCLLYLLPVITGGGALTALYTLLPEIGHLSFDSAFARFFHLVRTQWKRALAPWLLALAVSGILISAWRVALLLGITDRFALMLPLLLVSAAAAFCLLWLFPVLAAQEDASWSLCLQTAFLLGLRELMRSLLLLATAAALLLLALWCSGSLTRIGLWLFFGIAPLCWVQHFLVRSVLKET